MRFAVSIRLIAVAVALVINPVMTAHAQDSTDVAPPAWFSAGLGYASPGLARSFEGWVASGRMVLGLVVDDTEHGGFDRTSSSFAYSLLGGVRQSLGPVRAMVAIGAAGGAHLGGESVYGVHPAWQVSATLPFTKHVALQVARSALIGAAQSHAVETIGLSIGMVR